MILGQYYKITILEQQLNFNLSDDIKITSTDFF